MGRGAGLLRLAARPPAPAPRAHPLQGPAAVLERARRAPARAGGAGRRRVRRGGQHRGTGGWASGTSSPHGRPVRLRCRPAGRRASIRLPLSLIGGRGSPGSAPPPGRRVVPLPHGHWRDSASTRGQAELVRRHAADAPDQAEPLQQPDEAEAAVDLPPEEAGLGGVRVVVVVVVPAVPEGQQRQQEAVAAGSPRPSGRSHHGPARPGRAPPSTSHQKKPAWAACG